MIMVRFKTSAALLALSLTAGCGYNSHDGAITHVSNPTLSSVNQPVVQRTDYVLDLNASGGLSDAELARLDHWFASLQVSYGDRVFLDGGYSDPRARADVARVAASYGLLVSEGAPITAGSPQPGSIRVIVSRATASVPGCPIWENPKIGQSVRTSTNFGCSFNSNLAAMVADPNDLVLGQTAPVDVYTGNAAKAAKAYRDRITSGVNKVEGSK